MKFLKRSKQTKRSNGNFAFIDSQNLNLGTQKFGWNMDWKKFREFLSAEYEVEKAFLFIGYIPENEQLYNQLHSQGYLVVLKPTVQMANESGEERPKTKGNVDADVVLYAMKEINHYEKAVIVSGDGDFFSLFEYLVERKKLKNILVPNWQYSTLLKDFNDYIVRLDTQKYMLKYTTKRYKKTRKSTNKK